MEWLETVCRGEERFRAPDGKVLVLTHQHVRMGEELSPDEMGTRAIVLAGGCPLCGEMTTNPRACRGGNWEEWHFSQETQECPTEGCSVRSCAEHLEAHAWRVHFFRRCRGCGSWEKPKECQACFGIYPHPLCSACYDKHAETPEHQALYSAWKAAEDARWAEMAQRAAEFQARKQLQQERYQRYLERKAARKR